MKLDKLKSKEKALPDLLNYATVVQPGVVLGKDGSLLAGWYYRGEDNDSITNEERNAISARLNDKFRLLDSGWTLQTDAIRVSAAGYPARDRLFFPDPITRLIDEERREMYEKDYQHYETVYVSTLSYLPPSIIQSKIEDMMYEGDGHIRKKSIAQKILNDFHFWIEEFAKSLEDVLAIERMTAYQEETQEGQIIQRDELVDYLNWCISGTNHPINLAAQIPFLDGVIGNYDFVGGLEPIVDSTHIAVVAIAGFPLETYPGMLSVLDSLPLEYRWSNRYIYMDNEETRKELSKYRRKWKQKERGLMDQVLQRNGVVDRDAVKMVDELEQALADANSQLVSFGFFTSNIILLSENKEELIDTAKNIARQVKNLGFPARIETINAVEAWLGSLPGHSYLNIRRPIMHTMNLTDLLPLSSIWSGREINPCDKYPSNSPALVYTDTAGATTFRLNLHVGDLGHTLVFGPTAAGKSTLLNLIASQFQKYQDATFFGFDKGYSLYCLTKASGNSHFDVAGEDSQLQFCPLGKIDSDSEQAWAEDWVKICCELQLKRDIKPNEKSEIHKAMLLHRQSGSKTYTEFVSNLQIHDLREALEHYCVGGAMGKLLDAETDTLNLSRFVVFEMESLMNYSDEDKLPVLLYIFHRIEQRLMGQPAMIMLDEAWIMLGHPAFRKKIREWLKVLRKNNCVVIMATQSLSDAEKSGIIDVLVESCPTKIYLPNPAAKSDVSRPFYERVGLNSTQIDLLSRAVPKRQYYVVSVEGNRLFELALGDLSFAFVAQSGIDSKKEIDRYLDIYGEEWTHHWLVDRDVNYQRFLQEGETL